MSTACLTKALYLLLQRASLQILRSTNSAGTGVLAPFGYNVQRFKTREFTHRCAGVFKGNVPGTCFIFGLSVHWCGNGALHYKITLNAGKCTGKN